jgi:hypothetical protein
MRHLVLTRSAYPASYPIEANRRRLELFRRVTVPSLASQTERDWAWLLMVDGNDPLLSGRMLAAENAGVPVFPVTVGQSAWVPPAPTTPDGRLAGDLGGPWHRAVAAASVGAERIVTTRIDDDDALAVDALARIRRAVGRSDPGLAAWMLPRGYRFHHNHVTPMRHLANMFVSLESLPDPLHVVMDVKHNEIGTLGPVRMIDEQPAWLWVRHADTRSDRREGRFTITSTIRRAYQVDWAFLGSLR